MHSYFKFINHYSTFNHSHPLSNEFLAGLPVWVKHHYKYYSFTMVERKKLHYHYLGKLLATQQWHSPVLGVTASKLVGQACTKMRWRRVLTRVPAKLDPRPL